MNTRHISTHYETAEYIADAVEAPQTEALKSTVEYLHYRNGELTPGSLRMAAPMAISRTDAENIVFRLRQTNILGETLNSTGLDTVFDFATVIAFQVAPPQNTPVATLPDDDPVFKPLRSHFASLIKETIDLVNDTQDRLFIMSPFLSRTAYSKLETPLKSAAKRDVYITVITRYLTYGDTQTLASHNRSFINGVLTHPQIRKSTQADEYINHQTDTTFHAKTIINDTDSAYLGTANFTGTGFDGNLELGTIFRDETVSVLCTLSESILSSDSLAEVTADGNGFSSI
jgi:phosphatidylserine/phosphatidylglycerophosphate/cardiolipin synthase-like enzyme